MRFNSSSINKLAEIFAFKYYEVIGSPNKIPQIYKTISDSILGDKTPPSFSSWMKYLEDIGCRIVPKISYRSIHYVYVDDACHSENKIEVPKDLAERALVLGYLP